MSAGTHPAHPVSDNRVTTPYAPSGASRRMRQCAPRAAFMAAAVLALACPMLAVGTPAFANSYERGNWRCSDFSEAEQQYKANPKSIYGKMEYAHCLVTRGQGNDDTQGLAILHSIVDNSTERERVKAAWMIANYLSSGGTFEDRIDESNIDEAIKAFKRVVFFIDLDPSYPFGGNEFYEEEAQMELKTHYFLPLLYFQKFKYGSAGSDHMYLLSSPSYDGDRNLETYPKHSPYAIDSLEKMIEFSNQCLALPNKRHFQIDWYNRVKAGCRVLRKAATTILPLERQVLVLLGTYSCSNDVYQCDEYNEILLEKVSPIIIQANSDLEKIFN